MINRNPFYLRVRVVPAVKPPAPPKPTVPYVRVRMDEDSCKVWSVNRERNDCTVRATAIALDITYADAHARMAKLGRKPRKGARYALCAPKLGMIARPDLGHKCWKTVAPLLTSGRFVIRVAHHVFAVVDGVPSEYSKPLRRIKMVYEVPPSHGAEEISVADAANMI